MFPTCCGGRCIRECRVFGRPAPPTVGRTLAALEPRSIQVFIKGFIDFEMWYMCINPQHAKLIYSNFHPLEVVSRYRDPQLQVC